MNFTNKDILFVVNPYSGKKNPEKIISSINNLDSELSVIVSKTFEDMDEYLDNNISKYKVFVVAGGDGTINYMANKLFGRDDKVMAIIPRGSGNGFARETGFKQKVKHLLDDIYRGNTIGVDIMQINDKKFINVAGIGFDSCVAHEFPKLNRRGFWGYFLSTFRCFKKFKYFEAEISFDDKKIKDKFQMISIANTRQFGNNAYIAPKANPSSGKLDLVLVKPFPKYYYPIFTFNVFTLGIKDSKYISYYQTSDTVTLNTQFKKFHIDGEPIVFDENISIKVHKGALRIIKTSKNRN